MNDDEFLRSFEVCTFPIEQWTHRAHVKVAYQYLKNGNLDDAVAKMRREPLAYIETNGAPSGPTMGYNETTTVACMHFVYAMICE